MVTAELSKCRGAELDHRFRDCTIAGVVDEHQIDRPQQARLARHRHRNRQLAQRRVELGKVGVVRDDADRQRRRGHVASFASRRWARMLGYCPFCVNPTTSWPQQLRRPTPRIRYRAEALRQFAQTLFERAGARTDIAADVATILLDARLARPHDARTGAARALPRRARPTIAWPSPASPRCSIAGRRRRPGTASACPDRGLRCARSSARWRWRAPAAPAA